MKRIFPIAVLISLMGYGFYDNWKTHQITEQIVKSDSVLVENLIDSVFGELQLAEEEFMEQERLRIIHKDSLDSVARVESYENQLLWEENSRLKVKNEEIKGEKESLEKRRKLEYVKTMEPIKLKQIQSE